MKFFTLFAVFLFSTWAHSQQFKLGKLSQEEISLTEVSYEPGSDAVKLAEFGDLKITNTGYELMEYGRTKILTTSGLDYAQRKWSFRPEKKFDKVVLKEAQTINVVDGKTVITPVEKKDIIVSQNNGLTEIAVAFPNVKVGSVIEYKVLIMRPHDLFATPWRFQNNIPTLSSKLNLTLATDFEYRVILNGAELTKKYSGKKNNREWELSNIPSDKIFKNVYNKEDYREKLSFQFTAERNFHGTFYAENTWDGFKKLIAEEIAKSLKGANYQDIANDIKTGTTKFETLKNTIIYLRKNFTWNRYWAVTTKNLQSEFLRTKKGNAADFNILLNEVLKKKGIYSEMAVNSLRSNGQIILNFPTYSKMQTFVNIVESDGGEKIMVDAATSDPENLMFPNLNYFNNIVLGLNGAGENFLSVTPKISEFVSVQKLKINETNNELTIEDRAKGYFVSEDVKRENFYVFSGAKNETPQNYTEKDWNMQKQFVNFENTSPYYLVESPLTKTMRELEVSKNRNFPIALNFPFLITVELKTKLPATYQLQSENFNRKITSFNGNLQYIQNIERVGEEDFFTWSLLVNKVYFNTNEIAEYMEFIDLVNASLENAAVIKKIK